MKALNIQRPFYIDIGSNDPVILNNTFAFYKANARGICIEPNPKLMRRTRSKRPGDICLAVGIGTKSGSSPYYMMKNHVLNTFSKKAATEAELAGYKVDRVIQVPMRTLNDIAEYMNRSTIDLLSIDVEGMDLDILRSIDWDRLSIKVICVETKGFSDASTTRGGSPIIKFLLEKGFEPVASTLINTIFVESKAWSNANP